MNDLTVIIPAAGLGRRMRSYGAKALVEVAGGKSLIERQILLLREVFPDADIVVVVGFEAERVCRRLPPGVRVVENECFEFTNVARSIHMGLRASSCRAALIVYGDLVFNREALAGLPPGRSAVLVDRQGRMNDFEVGCVVQDGVATSFEYGLPTKWGQVALLAGRELKLFRHLAAARERRRHFGYEVLNALLERGGRLLAVEPEGMGLVEVDTAKDLDPARSLA